MGWGATVTSYPGAGLDAAFSAPRRWILIACDPDELSEEFVALLASKASTEGALVVGRAGRPGGPLTQLAGAARRPERIAGKEVCWAGPGPERRWHCRQAIEGTSLELGEGTAVWTTLEGAPLIAARRVGRGVVATLGCHPSAARDAAGAATALLRHLLICGAGTPVAWFDFTNTMVLRMDDPGGAQNVYLQQWCYPKLGETEWSAIGADLKRRNARMSLGYVAGWVDDGDPERGALQVKGQTPKRIPGQTYPSPLVQYEDRQGHAPGRTYDYQAEFRGIQALRATGLVEVELHGYTHMHPDTVSWAQAPDRYEQTEWFRELGVPARATIAARGVEEHPLSLGMEAFQRYFGVRPTTLICPGYEWTPEVLEHALDLGLQMVDSYYLALCDEGRYCWSTHVCAPYLNEPDAAWFDAGLPVVGCFHEASPSLWGWLLPWHWDILCGPDSSFRDLALVFSLQFAGHAFWAKRQAEFCGSRDGWASLRLWP